MKAIQLLSLLLVSIIFSCRKQLPALPDSETPVFYVQLDNPSFQINLKAGMSGVTFDDEVQTIEGVKKYVGFLEKQDTNFRLNFFAGEVFRPMELTDFLSMTNISPISLNSAVLHTFALPSLTNSDFTSASFNIGSNTATEIYDFTQPGIYPIEFNASRNGLNFSTLNTVIIGYENPYTFELQGNINTSGPGILIEGEIISSQSIQRIEWTCGNNSQITSTNFVQFPTSNSANELTAKVTFNDGVTRTRTVGIGLENGPRIQDYVYQIEQATIPNFSHTFEIEMEVNGQTFSSRFATDFTQGLPTLNILKKSIYTDPVTKQSAYLIKAQGLIYLKNENNNQTYPLQIDMQIGLPVAF